MGVKFSSVSLFLRKEKKISEQMWVVSVGEYFSSKHETLVLRADPEVRGLALGCGVRNKEPAFRSWSAQPTAAGPLSTAPADALVSGGGGQVGPGDIAALLSSPVPRMNPSPLVLHH